MGLYLIAAFDMALLGERLWQIGSVACGLGFVIFVHELGHFLVAKWCGVKCEKFYVGFDVPIKIFGYELPSKLVHYQWGETEYGIGIIPLGGYVKMLGQDDDPRVSKQEEELARIRVKKQQEGEGSAEQSELAAATGGSERAGALREGTAAEGMSEGKTVEKADQDGGYELDPRSFPAKTVPARMAIISAGVIMNLIFAIIFATCAFRAGVPYTPCEVGGVMAGSPAWTHGVIAGTRIVQVGERERRKKFLRFQWDLSNAVNMASDGEKVRVVTQESDGNESTYEIVPTVSTAPGFTRRMLGIAPARTNRLGKAIPVRPGSAAAKATPALEGGDVVTAINGKPISTYYDIEPILAANPTGPLTMTVERSATKGAQATTPTTLTATITLNSLNRIGAVMKAGRVNGIRPNSPAAQAGFVVGDLIETIAGEPLGDPMSLPTQLRPHEGNEIEVQVNRNGELVTLSVTPQTPDSLDWSFSYNSPMAAQSLGLAISVEPVVHVVLPGSEAEAQGIQAGDRIKAFNVLYDNPQSRNERRSNKQPDIEIDGVNATWPYVFESMQGMTPDKHSMKLVIERDGRTETISVKPRPSNEVTPDRGLVFEMKSETYVADSWSEAADLGAARTWEDAQRVVIFLRKLVTGQIAFSNVGGPLTIAYVAGSEASEGLPRLLIFLTFLSANLAVVNFLPIPALDGGHFLFLCWEGISGKPVNERVQIALTLAGVACLLGLMILVVGMDINRLFF